MFYYFIKEMYNKILNPNTKQPLDINSSGGRSIVNAYLNEAQGGSVEEINLSIGEYVQVLVNFNDEAEQILKENILSEEDPEITTQMKQELRRLQQNKEIINDKVYIWMDGTVHNLDENNNFYIKDDNDDVLSLDQISALKMRYNGEIIWER